MYGQKGMEDGWAVGGVTVVVSLGMFSMYAFICGSLGPEAVPLRAALSAAFLLAWMGLYRKEADLLLPSIVAITAGVFHVLKRFLEGATTLVVKGTVGSRLCLDCVFRRENAGYCNSVSAIWLTFLAFLALLAALAAKSVLATARSVRAHK